jgi:hypothetical protein
MVGVGTLGVAGLSWLVILHCMAMYMGGVGDWELCCCVLSVCVFE